MYVLHYVRVRWNVYDVCEINVLVSVEGDGRSRLPWPWLLHDPRPHLI
jgi:hypothetical protein